MNQDQQQTIIEQYISAYNSFDVPGMLMHLHEEVTFRNISGGEVNLETKGKAAFAEQAEMAKNYFRERRQTVTNWEFTPEKTRLTISYSGTLAVDLPNGMKAGETMELDGHSEFTFSAGQIIGITDIS